MTSPSIPEKLVVGALAHLLERENWARERLRPHAGAVIRIEAGPWDLGLRIDEQGMLADCESGRNADVILRLPADAPIRMLLDRQGLFAAIRLEGAADIAEALAFVFRNLRWDVEEDMARVVGDIPARRLSLFGSRLARSIREGGQRFASNVAEFAAEESGMAVPSRAVGRFVSDVDRLRDDLARLEKRIQRLS